MLVGQGAKTRPHFQTSCYLLPNNTHFQMQSGMGRARQGKEGPKKLLRLGTERALSLSFTGRRATYYVPTYWLANLPFLGGERERPNPVAYPSLFTLLLVPHLLTLVCMKGVIRRELCAWLPSCTGDGVQGLVARIASCHLGLEWVKGSPCYLFSIG